MHERRTDKQVVLVLALLFLGTVFVMSAYQNVDLQSLNRDSAVQLLKDHIQITVEKIKDQIPFISTSAGAIQEPPSSEI